MMAPSSSFINREQLYGYSSNVRGRVLKQHELHGDGKTGPGCLAAHTHVSQNSRQALLIEAILRSRKSQKRHSLAPAQALLRSKCPNFSILATQITTRANEHQSTHHSSLRLGSVPFKSHSRRTPAHIYGPSFLNECSRHMLHRLSNLNMLLSTGSAASRNKNCTESDVATREVAQNCTRQRIT
ncbi:KLTH0G16962p [Lachancea thermotolerans CBS 6340]|uniref:KLTH0G16962p n=1 Tax=Lachancea thermotolerans (strain ATCC 56472 / CBS 6340 / NRRL Y-8284) TaxID=559295 RepID=C5DNH0_LACTC|nr:KLTH0G16962p [Lachancea thermotolerans CBS 6340]CAR25331.1 KLTH0G16962p [Lachancea thermotolerans CBS 6340]